MEYLNDVNEKYFKPTFVLADAEDESDDSASNEDSGTDKK